MKNRILLGLWRYIFKVPPSLLEKGRARSKEKFAEHMAFMTKDHRLVHHHVVRELPYAKSPIQPEAVATALGLTIEQVRAILDDLEKHMTFIYRNQAGEIVWAYPVTLEKTPHHVTFGSGETCYAA